MDTRTRNLLTVALATALAAPFAVAQTETTQQQLDRQETADELPPQVNPNEAAEQSIDPRLPVADDAEDPMSAVPPPAPPARSDAQSTLRTDVAQDRWSRLDTDADGRISQDEGTVDADFNAGFTAMDTDGDGYVSRAEFDARHGMKRDRMKHDGMKHDSMDHEGMRDRDRMDDDGTGDDATVDPTGAEAINDSDEG